MSIGHNVMNLCIFRHIQHLTLIGIAITPLGMLSGPEEET